MTLVSPDATHPGRETWEKECCWPLLRSHTATADGAKRAWSNLTHISLVPKSDMQLLQRFQRLIFESSILEAVVPPPKKKKQSLNPHSWQLERGCSREEFLPLAPSGTVWGHTWEQRGQRYPSRDAVPAEVETGRAGWGTCRIQGTGLALTGLEGTESCSMKTLRLKQWAGPTFAQLHNKPELSKNKKRRNYLNNQVSVKSKFKC